MALTKNVRRSKTANKHHKKRHEILIYINKSVIVFPMNSLSMKQCMTFFMRVFYDVYSEVLTGL